MQRLTTQDWLWARVAYLADSDRAAVLDALSHATGDRKIEARRL
jgi:hypothetical protein